MRKIVILTALGWSMSAGVSGPPAAPHLPALHQPSPSADSSSPIPLPVYSIRPAVDIPLVAAAAAWDLYNFSQISQKSNSSLAEVESLKISKIDWFDRWAVHPYNHSIDELSYKPFFLAMPLPLIVFGIDKKMRKDFWELTFLYGEAMTLTGVLYTSAVHYVNRHRPLVYESASPIGTRESSNSRNSFFAGHVALVGTSVFFIASAYEAEHPDSRYKWAFYSGAAAMTALTGYWRNLAGEHFPTDITLGAAVGAASGLLVPLLHQHVKVLQQHLNILPFTTRGTGLTMLYRFG